MLPLHQQFEKRLLAEAIESSTDLDELKSVARDLLELYFQQKHATAAIVSGKI
ncbi:hypothetical protein [Synechococcus sp. UW140]|uniref:hypothetical protein n=1 Tax=Synechococcus sp. UW140 TaxID=368503 RepID=UPI0014825498|nr:hypothetical protein [Synechococcus sp. UW140]